MRLLDTDVCIEILRGNDDVIVRRAECVDEVATTWITAGELYYGAAKSRDPSRNRGLVASFLQTLPVLQFTPATARAFGDTKAELERTGMSLADADLWIASCALSSAAIVVTGNLRHYERIPDLDIEDWIRG